MLKFKKINLLVKIGYLCIGILNEMLVEGLVGLSCVKTDQINFRQFWQILYHLAVLLRWYIQTARHLSQHLLYQ